jgi:hypothetical protein
MTEEKNLIRRYSFGVVGGFTDLELRMVEASPDTYPKNRGSL